MTAFAFLRLFARRSVTVTFLVIAAAVGGVAYLDYAIGDVMPRIFFALLYNVAAFALLISFGGFVGRALRELARVRLSRVIPGLRRRATLNAALLVPLLSGAVTLLLWITRPGQFNQVAPFTYWTLAAFALALGLGLSGSWGLVVVVGVIALKLPVILPLLHTHPVAVELVALSGALVCLGLRHVRFLPPLGSGWSTFSELGSPLVLVTKAREAGPFGVNRPLGPKVPPGLSVTKLMAAGVYERFGHSWASLLTRTFLWVAIIDASFGLILYALTTVGKTPPVNFTTGVFASSDPTLAMTATRGLFAALTGCSAYISAVMLDPTLRPNLWHPVPRVRMVNADFCSRLRQNLLFAGIHLALTMAFVLTFTAVKTVVAHGDVLLTFALPSLIALVLMPIPQALFPSGADTFRRKTDPGLQLAAGVLGGLFCLLTVYWTFHWPLKLYEGTFSPPAKVLLVVLTAAISHLAYYACLRHHYACTDLRGRTV